MSGDGAAPPPSDPTTRPAPSFLTVMRAVFWSFLGIRRARDYQADIARIRPIHVFAGGLLGAALFIGALLCFVFFVVL
ncbi:MAG: DUF2970 domain-containing protein [Burkholderiales bacterium]|jgi:hypothetical protein|nr:DUF2970 domain-containing protein [Burkholderiales bacterium]